MSERNTIRTDHYVLDVTPQAPQLRPQWEYQLPLRNRLILLGVLVILCGILMGLLWHFVRTIPRQTYLDAEQRIVAERADIDELAVEVKRWENLATWLAHRNPALGERYYLRAYEEHLQQTGIIANLVPLSSSADLGAMRRHYLIRWRIVVKAFLRFDQETSGLAWNTDEELLLTLEQLMDSQNPSAGKPAP